ncbi:MAG: ATP-binding protein [Candidatus Zixiibacteriota bacterium]
MVKRLKKSGKPAAVPAAKPGGHDGPTGESLEELKGELEDKLVLLTETNRQLKRKIFDLYTIFEISRNFSAVLKYQSLLDTFIFTCLGQVGALKGAIFLKKDGQGEKFYLTKYKGSGNFPPPEHQFESSSRVAEYLTKLNRPVLTAELLKDLATPSETAILLCFDPGIIVPLIYQTRLIGIFAMADKISGREFQTDDIEFLSILGNQIAVAIENARLYEGERLATQQLRAAQEQLIQSERMAALGEMSAKIAHEVNNPLGIIKNYLVLIKRAAAASSDVRAFTGIVEQEIDRIAAIVRQLLDFHRPKPLKFEPLSVPPIIAEVLVLTERLLAANNIALETRIDAPTPAVLAVADNLKQVFLNLIINARDAMPESGRLTISVYAEGESLTIDFCDTGPGIPEELVPRVFDPFFTTKEPGKGTGLGLSVCHSIIRSHNGSITFRNLHPGGCFSISLPTAPKDKGRQIT